MKQVKPNAWNGHFAIVEYDTETGAERRQEITDEEWKWTQAAAPANFPEGYKKKIGLFYKTDADGKVTEIRNLFGCDITARADINLLFGCRTKGGSE